MSGPDHGDAYRALRERVTELMQAAPAQALDDIAPATPAWRVRDVLAHLVGVTADVLAGRLDGVATDAWTARQVAERRERSVADLLAEWEGNGVAFDDAMRAAPDQITGQAVFDAVTHEHDLRHALGVPGARDSDAVGIAWTWIVAARGRGGGPALALRTEDGEFVVGTGSPVATVAASRFELLRAQSGRRTASEVVAYEWHGEPDPEALLAAPIFSLRTTSLRE
jgi:uncharacterized protein (TIGR03083 family)